MKYLSFRKFIPIRIIRRGGSINAAKFSDYGENKHLQGLLGIKYNFSHMACKKLMVLRMIKSLFLTFMKMFLVKKSPSCNFLLVITGLDKFPWELYLKTQQQMKKFIEVQQNKEKSFFHGGI